MEPVHHSRYPARYPTGHPAYVNTSFFSTWERKMDSVILDHVPGCVKTYHLTLATIIWSAVAIVAGFYTRGQLAWVWVISLSIALHYITDHFDGAVGRKQGTGLVKWGYYMDHFLDFIFLCAVFIGYLIAFPSSSVWIVALLSVSGAFMVHSFLLSLATGRFHISHLRFGPTEFQVLLLILNAAIYFFDGSIVFSAFRTMTVIGVAGLGLVVYRTQKELWNLDMEHKAQHGS